MTQYDEWNQSAAEWMRNTASDLATAAYNTSRANNESDSIALERAKFAWQQTMDKAGLTGKFEDNWTMKSNETFLNQFGQWMPQGPQAGQETMAREQQTYNQGAQTASMYGQAYAPGQGPAPGTQTQAAINQANQLGLNQGSLTGYYTDPQGNRTQTLAGQQQGFAQGLATTQEQRAAQAQQQTQTQAYLQLLSSLRGPADWAKYQQVLGSTPNGMRDLAAAAMGQYTPGGGATTGVQPQAVSLQSMMGDVSGVPYQGQGGGQLQQPNVYQGGQGSYGQQPQAQTNAQYMAQPQMGQLDQYRQQMQQMGGQQQMQQAGQQYAQQAGQYQPQVGNMQYDVMPNGQPQAQNYAQAMQQRAQQGQEQLQGQSQAWGSGIGVGQQQATPAQQQQGQGNGTNTMGNLPAPNQISSQSWKNMQPSQQQMLLGQYEAQGWDKTDVQSLMNQALPKYGSNAPTAGTFRLR